MSWGRHCSLAVQRGLCLGISHGVSSSSASQSGPVVAAHRRRTCVASLCAGDAAGLLASIRRAACRPPATGAGTGRVPRARHACNAAAPHRSYGRNAPCAVARDRSDARAKACTHTRRADTPHDAACRDTKSAAGFARACQPPGRHSPGWRASDPARCNAGPAGNAPSRCARISARNAPRNPVLAPAMAMDHRWRGGAACARCCDPAHTPSRGTC